MRDIDTYSQTLREYQACIYKKALPRHKNTIFDLKLGNNPEYDYLYWNSPNYYGDDLAKSRFASDSIVNMQERYQPYLGDDDFVPDLKDKGIRKILKEYVKSASTIGGEIIFPKHPNSVNVARGRNPKIRDRFDLTLECIRRFYEKSEAKRQSPLYDVLKADEKFFNLFKDFDNYVKFFYLDGSYVQGGKIKFFIGDAPDFDNPIFTPFPTSKEEWEQLYENQMACVAARNKKISDLFAPNDSIK
jgi:hypothetical protein